ncbi:RecB family exonuclease [Haliangium ochraceum]|uniref:PD-(D/E)XK endonuclease-like domain-containing protein n=1 Tax=Haliangium ochraceum (strain DSM 14365 / JCM 11303 / SMP-2) TaxID=502025 RepID=D0LQR1_HALO1|nr:PD-(D/E)XK nuclease family protein [Haliangium ochraceum]ACY13621.1 conserved hypothetical protein [Haliangium ochraceum DSM 14365]
MPRLSYSRLSRYEACPLSYRLHYIDQHVADRGEPVRFGTAVHAALEHVVREHLAAERCGPLSHERVAVLWQNAWTESGLSGLSLFREGLALLHRFVREQGVVDHLDVLAVEQEFRITVGGFEVLGYLDRVDRVDDETVDVVDYKTNRQLFTRDELDGSLQMSLYQLAAQSLWPWAKKVRLTFWMLRHGVQQRTERTTEDLEATRRYVGTIGRAIDEASDYPARLNSNCTWCDHKQHCPAYAAALEGKRDVVCEDEGDLEAVARQREEVASLAKILYSRKSELERVLKAHLAEQDELVLGGVRYAMFHTRKRAYPLASTLAVLARASGLSEDALLARIAGVDNKALDALLKELTPSLGRAQARLVRTELEALASETHSPRLWARKVAT